MGERLTIGMSSVGPSGRPHPAPSMPAPHARPGSIPPGAVPSPSPSPYKKAGCAETTLAGEGQAGSWLIPDS